MSDEQTSNEKISGFEKVLFYDTIIEYMQQEQESEGYIKGANGEFLNTKDIGIQIKENPDLTFDNFINTLVFAYSKGKIHESAFYQGVRNSAKYFGRDYSSFSMEEIKNVEKIIIESKADLSEHEKGKLINLL